MEWIHQEWPDSIKKALQSSGIGMSRPINMKLKTNLIKCRSIPIFMREKKLEEQFDKINEDGTNIMDQTEQRVENMNFHRISRENA